MEVNVIPYVRNIILSNFVYCCRYLRGPRHWKDCMCFESDRGVSGKHKDCSSIPLLQLPLNPESPKDL